MTRHSGVPTTRTPRRDWRPDRKGAGLLLIAAVWLLVGIAVLDDVATNAGPAPHVHIPADLRAAIWIGSAGLAAVAAWAKPARGWALATVVIMPIIRLASYLWAYAASLIPGPPPGQPDAWYSAAYHAAMLGLVVYVAYERDDRTEATPQEQA